MRLQNGRRALAVVTGTLTLVASLFVLTSVDAGPTQLSGLGLPAPQGVFAAPAMQAISATGVVSTMVGTCSPDAVLLDCDGNLVAQLRGPGGAGFFAPYLGTWVQASGSQQTCPAGDAYISVLTIQPQSNPCPGQGPATPTPGNTPPPPPPPPPTATPPATATPSAPGQGGPVAGDLAQGKAIFASTTQAGYPPEFAVDGNAATWWASEPGRHPVLRAQNLQWIYVDLGGEEQVTSMRMTWSQQRHARGYAVMVWSDAVRDWVQIGSTSRGDGDDEWQVRGDVNLRGRYFMLWLVNPYLSGLHYELQSWQIGGPGSGALGGNNVALGKTVVAESEAPGMPATAATDGDVNTPWESTGLPQWFYVDLGATINVDRANLRWVAGKHASDYGLYAWNGSSWYGIYTRRGGTGGDEMASFPAVRTRYVLLFAEAGPAGTIALNELEVYEAGSGGSGGGGLPPGPPTPIPFAGAEDPERATLPGGFGRALPAAPAMIERSDVTRDTGLVPEPGTARPDVLPWDVAPQVEDVLR
jgi:hypothetical protein